MTQPTSKRSAISPRERVEIMIRTNRHSMTVWSAPEVRAALDAYRAAILREVADEALTASEGQFLTFALDLADNRMANRPHEFTSEDYGALATFRWMAEEARS